MRDELETVVAAARAAGKAAMAHYGQTVSAAKADSSPVTAADHAANAVILAALRDAFPEDPVLSEESKDSLSRLPSDRVWIVDPLDGTKEFLARNGEFSIMIGLAVQGEAVLGVVYQPDGDVLYAAARGEGAWVERSGARAPVRCREVAGGRLRLVGSRSHADPMLVEMQRSLGITDVEPCGSVGVKCARIVAGERDLYVHPVATMKEWDTCAPEAIVREAGGSFTDCYGRALRYNKRVPVQPDGIVACGAGVLPRVVGRISDIFAARNAAGANA